jgi:hypothetical protein
MTRIALVFGTLAALIMSGAFLATYPFKEQIGFDRGAIIGYTSMVLAFLLVYFGIRSYRDNVAGGRISFGRAVKVGAMISAVACVWYVAMWQVVSTTMMPDYMDDYQQWVLEKARNEGESEVQIAERKAEMDKFAEMYKNPFIKAGFTLLEPLPVALVLTLVSAGVLSRRRKEEGDAVASGARVLT